MSHRSALARVILAVFALLVTAAVRPVHAAVSCTAEQGQLFIDHMRVTFFEGVITGTLRVSRK